jgi:hypothetical protein
MTRGTSTPHCQNAVDTLHCQHLDFQSQADTLATLCQQGTVMEVHAVEGSHIIRVILQKGFAKLSDDERALCPTHIQAQWTHNTTSADCVYVQW